MANKIITAVRELSNTQTITDTNEVVCIDTLNNRIGVKISEPQTEIDVSGTISTNILKTTTLDFLTNTNSNITYIDDFLKFEKSIFVKNDISVNNKIDCSLIITNDLSSINIDISNANINSISSNSFNSSNIIVNDISIVHVLNLNNINSTNTNKILYTIICIT